jgi:sugar/nucleoside kinase (ribokinase family)
VPDADLDVIAVGNAIVDVLSHADDAFLAEQQVIKGAMQLIDGDRAETLYAVMPPAVEISGGSAANTAVGVAALGGGAGFVGKVAEDQLGAVFAHDIRAAGVEFDVPRSRSGVPTARSLILVTPDAQRTMNTYLGVATALAPDDVDEAFIARAHVVYCEGYLWDVDVAKQAIRKAMHVSHAAGRRVALTLSDPFCVDRHRSEFAELVAGPVDIVFANEAEICSLYEVDDFSTAADLVREQCELAFLTRSEKGSLIIASGEEHEIAAEPVIVVDTTGAGDLYASGALYGLTHGLDLPACGKLAAMAAAEVISHVGARPEVPLTTLLARL